MNPLHQGQPQAQPAVPLPNGRPGHMQYNPPPPYQHHPQPYQNYPYNYPPQYARPPQPWPPYGMPMPMNRGYQQYQQMPPVNPYPIPQGYPPMRSPSQQAPSSSSVHSKHGMFSPASSSTSLPIPPSAPALPPSPEQRPSTPPAPSNISTSSHRLPFYPPVPVSFGGELPPRKSRRRRQPPPQTSAESVELPERAGSYPEKAAPATEATDSTAQEPTQEEAFVHANDDARTLNKLATPLTSQPSSDVFSTQPTTPSPTATLPHVIPQQSTPKASSHDRPASINKIPIIPAIPNIPAISRPAKPSVSITSEALKSPQLREGNQIPSNIEAGSDADVSGAGDNSKETPVASSVKAAPKSWVDIVRSNAPESSIRPPQMNGSVPSIDAPTIQSVSSLAEALNTFDIKKSQDPPKSSFLEPRGLVNTGNMCYMNSILQVLVFCVPFYSFLEKVGFQAAHKFKSDTPMMDAMIMFMKEFRIIDSAASVEKLRLRLKDSELEQYGESFIPEFVYDVIRQLPRFSSMRRGHQQDAEEFLGFLLEEMHDECSKSIRPDLNRSSSAISTPPNGVSSPSSVSTDPPTADGNGWLEVGPKQRAAITRSSGAIATESPITKIFGGKLRSELRVPGMKNSVTLEPYQPLQLDIGAPHVSNIIDALKGLTKPETLHGHFNSPRGPGTTATKQVSIETLPQVLILHLKRFQYDNTGGTQKIWKKVGYPLDLEIPKEVFPQHKRGGLMAHGGLPKYRLISVVYHHGKNASGGHYTVDVRRQEGREWIRLDDTIIRRIRKEDVAEGGSEEDPKVLAAALEQHKNDRIDPKNGNVYDQIGAEDEEAAQPEKPWSQVNGSGVAASKKWSGVANGVVTPGNSSGKATPRYSVKDNKVAYILFYQRVET